jgi:hypothetical protein
MSTTEAISVYEQNFRVAKKYHYGDKNLKARVVIRL